MVDLFTTTGGTRDSGATTPGAGRTHGVAFSCVATDLPGQGPSTTTSRSVRECQIMMQLYYRISRLIENAILQSSCRPVVFRRSTIHEDTCILLVSRIHPPLA